MFSSVLVANRGEIACRVIKTAKRMGIRTIAVYSEADRNAAHVSMADEAYFIGPAVAARSYLDSDKILEVAKRSDAAAIHPGYGFLSENADFAEAVKAAGIVWVGPPADAIRAMGLKDAAKDLMEAAKVPVVPGYHGKNQDPEFLANQASDIGYPVLIKAVAGGGGKGMRKVDDPDRFLRELKAAQREAKSSFGDDRVLVEKFVLSPRHIEIQVFADQAGNAVYLFERDCSLQRRHQKVVEEAPAPGMSEEVRAAMGKAAVEAAKAIGYEGAGTVEFIVDGRDCPSVDGFFFMEMNTRLQVEHPVTEMITGEDLVEWQFKVASGLELPKTQQELSIKGHAFEVRLYAEDPARKFFPSPGVLHHLKLPHETGNVRVDTGVRSGDEVTMFYDPMIAKIISFGDDRRQALRHLSYALAEVEVIGARTNASFLAHIAEHPSFIDAELDTSFIERHEKELIPEAAVPALPVTGLAVLYLSLTRRQEIEDVASRNRWSGSPWDRLDGWRLNNSTPHPTEHIVFETGNQRIDVEVAYQGEKVHVTSDGAEVTCEGRLLEDGSLSAVVDGRRMVIKVHRFGDEIHMYENRTLHVLSLCDPLATSLLDESASGNLTAPMSGKILAVNTEAGVRVRTGEALVVLEAMKMEHTLAAPADLTVDQVLVAEGDQVDEGQVVVIFDDDG
jgi:3-methylcrotonyl-CoA carboxylase alpha subunit